MYMGWNTSGCLGNGCGDTRHLSVIGPKLNGIGREVTDCKACIWGGTPQAVLGMVVVILDISP